MKNLFLILGIVLAFGITTANAQDKDIAMVSEKKSESVDKYKQILIEELKKCSPTLWKYQNSHFDRITIEEQTIEDNSHMQIINFVWTYEAPSEKKPGYNYVLTYRFHKSYKHNRVNPASSAGRIQYVQQ
jgi:hypothetical protein